MKATAHDALPLRTVSALTGLTPDLIRAWEKRHGVVRPVRGARGARLYSRADVRRLRLLAGAVGAGRSIGDVAHLGESALERLAAEPATEPAPPRGPALASALSQIARFDAAALSRKVGEALVGLGSRAFVREFASPLLEAVGERWSRGELSIADERLCSGVLRSLLSSLIHARGRAGRPVVVLATPAGERHELGLLLVGLLAVDAGLDVRLLGTDLPAAEIGAAAKRSAAALVGLGLVCSDNRARAAREVGVVERALPAQTELWLGGREARAVAARIPRSRARVIDDLGRAERELDALGLARGAPIAPIP